MDPQQGTRPRPSVKQWSSRRIADQSRDGTRGGGGGKNTGNILGDNHEKAAGVTRAQAGLVGYVDLIRGLKFELHA